MRGFLTNDPVEAVEKLRRIYNEEKSKVLKSYQAALNGNWPHRRVDARYPQVSIRIDEYPDPRKITKGYGYCPELGTYESTFTRPDVLGRYYVEQLTELKRNHPNIEFEVSRSDAQIPLPFVLTPDKVNADLEITDTALKEEDRLTLRNTFDFPDPKDYIIRTRNGLSNDPLFALSRYNAHRTDRALLRLTHYTGTDPSYFQRYILFTNYDDYIQEFIKYGKDKVSQKDNDDYQYLGFVEPGNLVTLNENIPDIQDQFKQVSGKALSRAPQMPSYHLVGPDGSGITMVNIGVGPSNAKTMTDELAPLRPHSWMMVGHCAGTAYPQQIGDYVLPNGFVVKDGLMEKELVGANVDLFDYPEIHLALKQAIQTTLDIKGEEYKRSIRTGPVVTVADRNWEVPETMEGLIALKQEFAQNHAIGVDMESGTIAANGLKHSIASGALLCISDKPMHGEPKIPGVSMPFYRRRVKEQFKIMVQCIDNLRNEGERVISRKLYSDFAPYVFR